MVFFNIWAETFDRYILLKWILIILIFLIVLILIYDFLKILYSKYKKIKDIEKMTTKRRKKILKDIEKLLWKKGKDLNKSFLNFLEEDVAMWEYNIDKLLYYIKWSKEDLYDMIYNSEEKNYEQNEKRIKDLLIDYKNWLER